MVPMTVPPTISSSDPTTVLANLVTGSISFRLQGDFHSLHCQNPDFLQFASDVGSISRMEVIRVVVDIVDVASMHCDLSTDPVADCCAKLIFDAIYKSYRADRGTVVLYDPNNLHTRNATDFLSGATSLYRRLQLISSNPADVRKNQKKEAS